MSSPEIFTIPVSKENLDRLAEETFKDMIKFVADLDRNVICAGGNLHADAKTVLVENGSAPQHLWGGKYYRGQREENRFVFMSMINIRPKDGNTQEFIQCPEIRQQVRAMATHFFEDDIKGQSHA